jgi:hypothetical protein
MHRGSLFRTARYAVVGVQVNILVLDGFSEMLDEHVIPPAALAVRNRSTNVAVHSTA